MQNETNIEKDKTPRNILTVTTPPPPGGPHGENSRAKLSSPGNPPGAFTCPGEIRPPDPTRPRRPLRDPPHPGPLPGKKIPENDQGKKG